MLHKRQTRTLPVGYHRRNHNDFFDLFRLLYEDDKIGLNRAGRFPVYQERKSEK